MDLEKAILERRSVRSYKSDPISEEDLQKILDAGRWAPSSGNTQPLELVVVENKKTKKNLVEAAKKQSFIAEAPIVIVVCANVPRTEKRYGERGRNLFVIQDTAAAIQNMLLMAYSLGYGTCWIGSFYDNEVAEIIEAPKEIKPVAIIPVGKPAESPTPPSKRNLEDIIHRTTF